MTEYCFTYRQHPYISQEKTVMQGYTLSRWVEN